MSLTVLPDTLTGAALAEMPAIPIPAGARLCCFVCTQQLRTVLLVTDVPPAPAPTT